MSNRLIIHSFSFCHDWHHVSSHWASPLPPRGCSPMELETWCSTSSHSATPSWQTSWLKNTSRSSWASQSMCTQGLTLSVHWPKVSFCGLSCYLTSLPVFRTCKIFTGVFLQWQWACWLYSRRKKTADFLRDAVETRLRMYIPYIDSWPQVRWVCYAPGSSVLSGYELTSIWPFDFACSSSGNEHPAAPSQHPRQSEAPLQPDGRHLVLCRRPIHRREWIPPSSIPSFYHSYLPVPFSSPPTHSQACHHPGYPLPSHQTVYPKLKMCKKCSGGKLLLQMKVIIFIFFLFISLVLALSYIVNMLFYVPTPFILDELVH